MKFEHKDKLDSFLISINQFLTAKQNQQTVIYSTEYVTPWNGDKLAEGNEEMLATVSGRANVYMLFTAKKDSEDYRLRYIGKTTQKLSRQRIRNHLFKKHAETGAKLDNIIQHVQSGGSVKIAWVSIEPESLRNWAEEELISCHPEADWNRENA